MSRPGARAARLTVAGLLAGLIAWGVPPSAAAQVPPDSAPPPSPSTGGWAGYAAVAHPWSTVTVVTVALPVGSALDPEGLGGAAWLLGESVLTTVRALGGSNLLHADVSVERSRTVYRIISLEDRWPQALAVLEMALFGSGFEAPGLMEAKAAIQASLSFRSGSPIQDFERELYVLLAGPGHPWARDPRGTLDSLARVGPAELILFRAEHYVRNRATMTVTGATDPTEVARAVTGSAPLVAAEGEWVVASTELTPASEPAWIRGDRLRIAPEVTSSWIAVGYPVARGGNLTALELFIHRVREELVTDPPAPGLFSAEIGLEYIDDRPVFLVRAAVLPEATDEWEARILQVAHMLSGEILDQEFFGWHRRRFRAAHLMEEMAPEDEGRRLALDLLRTGRIRDLPAEIGALRREDMARVAASLGEPRILVFGPDLGSGRGRPPVP